MNDLDAMLWWMLTTALVAISVLAALIPLTAALFRSSRSQQKGQ